MEKHLSNQCYTSAHDYCQGAAVDQMFNEWVRCQCQCHETKVAA